jgi:Zn-finger nucleic acid-binding protein
MNQSEVTQKGCARCGAPLFAATDGGFALEGCGACGGAWLAPAAAAEALGKRGGPAFELAQRLVSNTKPNPAVLARQPTCPDCLEPLSRVHVDGVELDVCATHGTWFDRGELLRMTRPEAPPVTMPVSVSRAAPQGSYPWLEAYRKAAVVLAGLSLVAAILGAVLLLDDKEATGWTILGVLVQGLVGAFLAMVSRDFAAVLLDLSARR